MERHAAVRMWNQGVNQWRGGDGERGGSAGYPPSRTGHHHLIIARVGSGNLIQGQNRSLGVGYFADATVVCISDEKVPSDIYRHAVREKQPGIRERGQTVGLIRNCCLARSQVLSAAGVKENCLSLSFIPAPSCQRWWWASTGKLCRCSGGLAPSPRQIGRAH